MTPEESAAKIASLNAEGNIEELQNYQVPSLINPSLDENELPQGTINCFDYYSFGSINADFSSRSSIVVSGTDIHFIGTIENENSYPVVNGTLYVKIFKIRGTEKDANGPDVVDQFIALHNIAIPANSSIPTNFTWKIPAYALTGDYQLATFFVTDNKFNLLGLSFTDDVVGNTYNFHINGESTGVYFDKSSVVINDYPYYFAAFPPRISQNVNADITLKIKNTLNKAQVVEILWKVYRWDSMDEENLISKQTITYQLNKTSEKIISYTVTDKDYPVYYIVGELNYKDSKSIVGIRFVREGIDRVRLNFPSILSFPLKKGEETSMFTCLHNSGTSSLVSNNKVEMDIVDKNGNVIDSYTYDGGITGAMMGLKNNFIPKNDLDIFSLQTKVYHEGILVDKSTITYDCNQIDPSLCQSHIGDIVVLIIALLLISIIVATIYESYKKKGNDEPNNSGNVSTEKSTKNKDEINNSGKNKGDTSTLVKSILIFLIVCFVSGMIVPVAEAKSENWDATLNQRFAHFVIITDIFGSRTGWLPALENPHVTVKYNSKIINSDTGIEINDGDTLVVGTNITLLFISHQYTDISWFGTGYASDSPYGEWKIDAAPPPISCESKDLVGYFKWNGINRSIYIPLVINPPLKIIQISSNLGCSILTGDEVTGYSMDCTIISTGPINVKFNFNQTYGEFYYRAYKLESKYDFCGITSDLSQSNNISLKTTIENFTSSVFSGDKDLKLLQDFTLQVPEKTIEYNLVAANAIVGNVAPNNPTITGPLTGYTSIDYTFNFQTIDPNGDHIRYGIDWDNTGTIIWTEYFNSGVSITGIKRWSTPGSKTLKVVAQDENGVLSGWTSHTINLDLGASCGDGTLDAGEQCDDNNNNNYDGCSATCRTELICQAVSQTCGDGFIQYPEQCELNDLSCDTDCTLL